MTARFLLLGLVLTMVPALNQAQSESPNQSGGNPVLRREYILGQQISYRMTASNRRPDRTRSYEAVAEGVVKQDDSGRFYEEYRWSSITSDGRPLELSAVAPPFVQLLSLSPTYSLSMPDLSRVHPALIGPVTDLLTFYADVWLAMRQPNLRRTGDRALIPHKSANSWADGTRVLLGEDAIDFDVAIEEIDESTGTATILVKHVPPAELSVRTPADWMRNPVADSANNWVQVSRTNDGKYRASIGKETFDVRVKLRLVDGIILSARMDNPVQVSERDCTDEALTECGNAIAYTIARQVEIAQLE